MCKTDIVLKDTMVYENVKNRFGFNTLPESGWPYFMIGNRFNFWLCKEKENEFHNKNNLKQRQLLLYILFETRKPNGFKY